MCSWSRPFAIRRVRCAIVTSPNLGRLDAADGQLDRLIEGLSRAAGRAAPEAPAFERALEVGGPWLLSALWDRLGLSRCLRGLTRADAKLDLDALTRVMVFNRLCDADSKLGVLRWMEEVVVPGVAPASVTHQRLLRWICWRPIRRRSCRGSPVWCGRCSIRI